MKKAPYAYSVVAYVHDPVAGERLNCALLYYAPSAQVLHCLASKHPHRLEKTFGQFTRRHHDDVLADLSARADALRDEFAGAGTWPEVDTIAPTLAALMRDQGLSYQLSPLRYGLTIDPLGQAAELLARFVDGQGPPEASSLSPRVKRQRSDKDVWQSFAHVARQRDALRNALQPVVLRTSGMDIAFDHAAKNGKYHVVQPISFDLKTTKAIADKVATFVGKSLAAKDAEELEQIFFLVGKPSTPDLENDYRCAVAFLERSVPVKHRIIGEDQVQQLADELEIALAHD